jgi:cytoskeletal protein RodZ
MDNDSQNNLPTRRVVVPVAAIIIIAILGIFLVVHFNKDQSPTSPSKTTNSTSKSSSSKSTSGFTAPSTSGSSSKSSSSSSKSSTPSTSSSPTLTNTGPGNTVAIFASVSIAAAVINYQYRKKYKRN